MKGSRFVFYCFFILVVLWGCGSGYNPEYTPEEEATTPNISFVQSVTLSEEEHFYNILPNRTSIFFMDERGTMQLRAGETYLQFPPYQIFTRNIGFGEDRREGIYSYFVDDFLGKTWTYLVSDEYFFITSMTYTGEMNDSGGWESINKILKMRAFCDETHEMDMETKVLYQTKRGYFLELFMEEHEGDSYMIMVISDAKWNRDNPYHATMSRMNDIVSKLNMHTKDAVDIMKYTFCLETRQGTNFINIFVGDGHIYTLHAIHEGSHRAVGHFINVYDFNGSLIKQHPLDIQDFMRVRVNNNTNSVTDLFVFGDFFVIGTAFNRTAVFEMRDNTLVQIETPHGLGRIISSYHTNVDVLYFMGEHNHLHFLTKDGVFQTIHINIRNLERQPAFTPPSFAAKRDATGSLLIHMLVREEDPEISWHMLYNTFYRVPVEELILHP